MKNENVRLLAQAQVLKHKSIKSMYLVHWYSLSYLTQSPFGPNITIILRVLDSIFKSRDIILPTKVRLVKALVFPVVMYGCESWTVKKAE